MRALRIGILVGDLSTDIVYVNTTSILEPMTFYIIYINIDSGNDVECLPKLMQNIFFLLGSLIFLMMSKYSIFIPIKYK